jgi:hypothetical protein
MGGLVLAIVFMTLGIVNLVATVSTIDSVGGWQSPDLNYVIDTFWGLAVSGTLLVTVGLVLAGMALLPILIGGGCVIGPGFSISLLATLHLRQGRRRSGYTPYRFVQREGDQRRVISTRKHDERQDG